MTHKMSDAEYGRYVARLAPKSKTGKDCLNAFWVGGTVCVLGQLLMRFCSGRLGMEETLAGTLTSVALIFLSAVLTAFSVYDDIARFAGAGTLVPITGFANAVVSPAMEYKTEGFITGLAVKMFSIAGPVLVYGISASVVYGVILWLTTVF